jgi:hypothetical protein
MISGILLADEIRDALAAKSICIQCPLCGQSHDIRIREPRRSADARAS